MVATGSVSSNLLYSSRKAVGVLSRTVAFVILCVVGPYLLGYIVASRNLETLWTLIARVYIPDVVGGWYERNLQPQQSLQSQGASLWNGQPVTAACLDKALGPLFQFDGSNPLGDISIHLHRNGEAEPCRDTGALDLLSVMKETLQTMTDCPDTNEMYQFESFWTRVMARISKTTCPSRENDRSSALGFYGFCDMGEERTPILTDHTSLVPIQTGDGSTYLPCHFHNYNGVRVTSLQQLAQFARTLNSESCQTQDQTCTAKVLHLYAVPAGRVFMFAPNYVGEIIPLPHVQGGDPDKPVYLKVLSVSPRVFDLVNFFSKEESNDLVERALAETSDTYRIKRSTTGAKGAHVNIHRTSESGFDVSGTTAMKIKRRCFGVLGFDKYIESHADGLQILRYNLTKAYRQHLDWIDGNDNIEHDFDSAKKGGNRFATILLYMTDMAEYGGGETVFTEAWPPGQEETEHVPLQEAISRLRESGDASLLEQGSWEEEMVANCRSRLAVRPSSARSVLFYSELPNGEADPKSLHGGCPVLDGVKYAANLWVWNTPRQGYAGSPKNPRYQGEPEVEKSVHVTFQNSGTNPSFDNAELYHLEKFWGKLGRSDPAISANSYNGNIWRLVVDGVEQKRWTIEVKDGDKVFTI